MSLYSFLIALALFWGVGNVFVKKGFQKLTPWQTYAFDAFFIAMPLWMIYGFSQGGNLFTITPIAVFAALFGAIVPALFYYVVSIGEVSLTTTIIGTYPIVTLILAFFLLQERLSNLATLGIILTVIGTILVSLPKKLNLKLEKWVYLSVVTAIGYGVSAYFAKLALNTVSNATYLILYAITSIIVVLIWKIFTKEGIPKLQASNFLYSFLGILLYNLGNIIYYAAIEKSFASIVVPLSNTYIVVTVLFSLFWLKEKIYKHQLLGILMVVIGVILVGFNSV